MKNKTLEMKMFESGFSICYLIFVYYAAYFFYSRKDLAAALMCLLLGVGDSFHLIPRIRINLKGPGKHDNYHLGMGNLISSVTMTLFYLLLFQVMSVRNPEQKAPHFLYLVLLALTSVRLILCTFPQNDWLKKYEKDNSWHIIRNVPFVIIGLITIYYLIAYYRQYLMAFLVFASFLCYMIVVLFASKKKALGMFMIPKTICYIWMIILLMK